MENYSHFENSTSGKEYQKLEKVLTLRGATTYKNYDSMYLQYVNHDLRLAKGYLVLGQIFSLAIKPSVSTCGTKMLGLDSFNQQRPCMDVLHPKYHFSSSV